MLSVYAKKPLDRKGLSRSWLQDSEKREVHNFKESRKRMRFDEELVAEMEDIAGPKCPRFLHGWQEIHRII